MAAAGARAVKKIVVGVDGSDSGKAALEWAARLAKSSGAEVIAVYALDLPIAIPEPYAMPVLFDDKWRAELLSEFETKWCRPLKAAGVRYRTEMHDGRPASVILETADRIKADIVAVGRRGRGEVAELLLGSVSHEVVLHSKRPVFLVPRKA
jgi:nucleotide-binding universal stress UspA family protein